MRVVCREGPGDRPVLRIPRRCQGCHLPLQRRSISGSSAESFATDDGDLDLGHVQPAAMDRSVVELELPQETPCFSRLEGVVLERA
jgi:hypothetical protein